MRVRDVMQMGIMFSLIISGLTLFANDWGEEYGKEFGTGNLNRTTQLSETVDDIAEDYQDDLSEEDTNILILTVKGTVKFLGAVFQSIWAVFDAMIGGIFVSLAELGLPKWAIVGFTASFGLGILAVIVSVVMNRVF